MTTSSTTEKPSPDTQPALTKTAGSRPVADLEPVRARPNWAAGIAGFALGGLLVMVLFGIAIGGILSARQAQPTPTRLAANAVRITPKTWPTPTAFSTQSQLEIQPTRDVFQEAQEMIAGGQSKGAIDLLGPQADQLSTETLRKTAYQLLAQAELNLNNYNLAAVYLEKAEAIQPDPILLWKEAEAYDQGGSLKCALDRYQAVSKERDPALEAMLPTAEARAAALKKIFPTQFPCK